MPRVYYGFRRLDGALSVNYQDEDRVAHKLPNLRPGNDGQFAWGILPAADRTIDLNTRKAHDIRTASLAYALVIDVLGDHVAAEKVYQRAKHRLVLPMQRDTGWVLDLAEIEHAIAEASESGDIAAREAAKVRTDRAPAVSEVGRGVTGGRIKWHPDSDLGRSQGKMTPEDDDE